MNETHLIEIERVRSEAARHLAEHEIACERRYGELQAQLTKIEALHNRNTRLLYILLGGMLAVATRAFWPRSSAEAVRRLTPLAAVFRAPPPSHTDPHRPDRLVEPPLRARRPGSFHLQTNWRITMLTLLGSLLGFATSAIPDIMSLFRERADRKHELAVLDRQMEQMRLGHTQRLEEIEVQADIAESKALYKHDAALGGSSRWVDGLRASVRPLITYAFFILFASVKGSGLYLLIAVEGLLIAEALPRIWDPETQALFAAVMSFWFGNRTLSKLRERR